MPTPLVTSIDKSHEQMNSSQGQGSSHADKPNYAPNFNSSFSTFNVPVTHLTLNQIFDGEKKRNFTT
jgi:hypothetical protein